MAEPKEPSKHPFHSMCSYLGCFPPRVPRDVIETYVPKRALVLDPFCGAGTTLVESLLLGRPCVGVDLNPLAVAVARAKTLDVTAEEVIHRIFELATAFTHDDHAVDFDTLPDGLTTIFHPRTLVQLCYLRRALDTSRSTDAFLLAALLGIMHGKFNKGHKEPRRTGKVGRPKKGRRETIYLSIDMPNTFSMSPEYVRGFVKKHKLTQLPLDVFQQLRKRVIRLLREGALPHIPPTTVIHGDATRLPEILPKHGIKKVDAIVTSPPYLGVLRYGAFNWIRLWMLDRVPLAVDRQLDTTNSMDRYLSFMGNFLRSAAEVVRPDGVVALVIGDVVDGDNHVQLADRVWEELGSLMPFRREAVLHDNFDTSVKTTRIWGEDKKGRATPLDKIMVLRRVKTSAAVRGQVASGQR